MKKFLFLAIAAMTFAACGNTNNKQQEEVVTETVVEQVTETPDSTATQCDSTKCAGCSENCNK